MNDPVSYRPDLPDFGIYRMWPTDGTGWIHPDDVPVVEQLIPSKRVFERFRFDGEYYWLRYGEQVVRVKPAMWTTVPALDLRVGEQVEILSCFGRLEPGIARIAEIEYDSGRAEHLFTLHRIDFDLPQIFTRDQIRSLHERHELRESNYEHPKAKYIRAEQDEE
ncbi:MAG: hypothetical protein U0892_17365 [Pirellulales bacterium]